MNTINVLSPFTDSPTVDLSTAVRRKQVLKLGSIDYKGQRITFDKPMLTELAASYKAGAYDSVPFMLADADNRHTADPTRARGEVVDLEVTDDGLDAVVKLSDEGAALVDANPRFGVSARLIPNLTRADGKSFPWALEHVLGTFNPRVTGLRPWETVNLSADDDVTTVDLSASTYEPEEPPVATIDLSKMDDDKADLVRNLAVALGYDLSGPDSGGADLDTDNSQPAPGTEDDGKEPGEQADPAGDENGRTAGNVDADGEGEAPQGEDPGLTAEDLALIEELAASTTADLSASDDSVDGRIDLANARAEQAQADASQARIDLAVSQWETERGRLAVKGVPPFVLDLAAPVLSQPGALVIDLAGSDDSADVTAVVRKLVAAYTGVVDLAAATGTDLERNDTEEDKVKAAVQMIFGR